MLQLRGKLSDENLKKFLEDEVLNKYNLLFQQAEDDMVSQISLIIIQMCDSCVHFAHYQSESPAFSSTIVFYL